MLKVSRHLEVVSNCPVVQRWDFVRYDTVNSICMYGMTGSCEEAFKWAASVVNTFRPTCVTTSRMLSLVPVLAFTEPTRGQPLLL